MKLLIIDDDKTLCAALAMMIETMGAEVQTACSAEEGIRELGGEDCDYVLLDMKMPEKDGLWFMRHARLPGRTQVIVMSSFLPGMLLKEMYQLGVCDYLEKPFDSQDLLDVLERHSPNPAKHDALQGIAA
jgi:DNA-binding NtrC family response regulator